MRIYNKYVLSLAIVSALINTVLAFFVDDDLSVYLAANVGAYLVITLMFTFLTPRARNRLNIIGLGLFICLMGVVAYRTAELVWGI